MKKKKTLSIIVIIFGILVILSGILFVVVIYPMFAPGKPLSPADCLKPGFERGEKLVVLLGDSLTHGSMGHGYIEGLQQEMGSQGWQFINAGVNADLAYNALQRVDDVIACQPDYVIVLIGMNDALGTLTPEKGQSYVQLKRLPALPAEADFKRDMSLLIEALQQNTSAKIALSSTTLFGEISNSEVNQHVLKFVAETKQLAAQYQLSYLPLNEAFWQALPLENEPENDYCIMQNNDDGKHLAENALRYYLLGQSWEKISELNDLQLSVDCVHLNATSADIVVDVFSSWLLTQ